MAREFTIFGRLSAELRLEIWRFALPDPVNHALYTYQKGCWVPGEYIEGDYDFSQTGENTFLKFDPARLDPLRLELPLLTVNREARNVAQDWVRRNSFAVQGGLVRRFNATTDTVFVPTHDLADFVSEPLERLFEPDLNGRHVSFSCPTLPRIAITRSGLEPLRTMLWDFCHNGGGIHSVCVLDVDDLGLAADDETRGWWEFEDHGRAHCEWNRELSCWEVEGEDGAALEWMKEFVETLGEELEGFYGGRVWLEFRLVDLVRK